jgi:hypothetical protein
MGVVLPFRRPEPRRSRFQPTRPVDDPYWLADALHLRDEDIEELVPVPQGERTDN